MKKVLATVLCFVLLFTCIIPIANAKELSEDAVIIVSQNANEQVMYAAQTLKAGIDAVTGGNIRIFNDTAKIGGYKIFVGKTVYSTTNTEGLSDGSYFIKSLLNGIEINGAGNRGNIYGVYRFLEEFAGYHCYSEKIGYKSYTGKLDIPAKVDIKYVPFFEYTDTDWHSPRDPIYSLANGLNGAPYRTLSEEQGGNVGYISNFCHTLSTQFCSSDKYFEEHPEYFALRDGKRVPNQLCLTNENVYNIVLEEVMTLLKDRHDPSAALQIISLTQHDNEDYCTCENCKALDDANGSQSGTMITFVNRIARAVKEAGYNNIAIDTFAYRYTRKAPTAVIPEDNVIVRLCTIECCFTHALDDSTCEKNVDLMQDLRNWNAICNHIYVWDYTTNYAYTAGIFPDFPVIQKNMQIFYEHGVKGVYEEGAYYVDACDTEFGELRAYLLSRLLQNPYCDLEAETDGFLNAFYGEGGNEMGMILDAINANAVKQHAGIYDNMKTTFSFTQAEAKHIDMLWEKAKADTTDDEFALANITRSELSWRYVKSSLRLSEFANPLTFRSNNQKLYHDLIDMGVTTLDEYTPDGMNVSKAYTIAPADQWHRDSSTYEALFYVFWIVSAIALIGAVIAFIAQ